MSAKWQAGTSTRVSINSSKNRYWKQCLEHRHTEADNEALSKVKVAKSVIQAQITYP